MKKIITRWQKDLEKLQKTIHKEGNDFLNKVRNIDLRDNIEETKREVEKALIKKLKKLEPAYHNFMEELRKNARKAGIDIDKIEGELREKAEEAGKRLRKVGEKSIPKKKKLKSKKKTKKTGGVRNSLAKTVKNVRKKVSGVGSKKTTKKTGRKKSSRKTTKKS